MENDNQVHGIPIEEKILERIPREVLGMSLLMALAASFLFDLGTGLFALAGGVLSAINFLWLNQTLTRVLLRDKRKALKISGLFFGMRFVLILAIFFIIIFFFSNKIIAFVAGFSTMLPVFLVEAAIALSKMKQWKS